MRRCRVLVVEDDEDVREALCLVLELAGYEVAAASHGAHALSLLATTERPRVILTDLMMPVMDGWTLAAELEKDPALASIPVVFVTAFTDPGHPQKKGYDVITKPISNAALVAMVEKHCAAAS